ncbi:MAG TPA: tetratricopeptide repeat protein [Edaphobacter sp.]
MPCRLIRSLPALTLVAVMMPLAQAQTSTARPHSSADKNENLRAADAAFRAGSAAFQQNDLHTAHVQFARLVRLAPQIAAGHTAFGTVLLAEGDPRTAAAQLELARKLDSTDINATLNLALAYVQLHDNVKAVAMFELVDRAKQTLSPEAAIAYAGALVATLQPAAAQSRLEQAVASAPDNPLLHDALGSLFAQQERYNDAGLQFQLALKFNPSLASAHYHFGALYLAQHDATNAVAELTQANTLTKDNLDYTLQLGRALRAANQDEQSATVFRRALQLDPNSIDTKYELALTLQASNKAREALPLFEQVAAARPKDSEVLINLGLALVQLGDAKRAIPFYLQALKLTPNSGTLREDLGVAYLQQSDLDHAIEQFRAGLIVEPDNPQLHYDLGLAFKLKDNIADAIPEFEQAAKLDPQLPDPPYTLGVLYMQIGRFPEAQAELEKATTLRPDNGDAWAMLGNVYKQNDDPQKAAAALRRAIELRPDQPSPHITLASILSQQGDTAGAAAERKKAADLSRVAVNRQRANFALDSGNLLLKRGQLAEAVAQFQTAVAADPNYAEAHAALADALAQQGRSADAALERQQAQKLTQANSTPHP